MQGVGILAHALVVNAEAQAAAYFMALLRDAVGLSKRADLEDVWIVPTFSQGRMGEDETNGRIGWVETQQSFLVLHDQVVGRHIVASGLLLLVAVLAALGLGVDGEVTLVGLADRDAVEILPIFRFEQVLILV